MTQPKPRQACRYCWHAVETHNLIEGCPHCGCLATPSEARPQNAVQSSTPVIEPGDYRSDDYRTKPLPTPRVREDETGLPEAPITETRIEYGYNGVGHRTYWHVHRTEPREVPAP